MRIVSLLPSATEIVCAVADPEDVVGISHECDFPPAIRDRPVLTRSRISPIGSSLAIDGDVRAALQEALSIYTVDAERLGALAPDVIVTQDLCEICAVSLDDVRAAVARLASRRSIDIVSLQPTRLDDVLDDVSRVARALGRAERGVEVRAELEARFDAIRRRAVALDARPTVVSVEWIEPLMLGGTWMPELIERAGGVPLGVEAGALAPTVDADQVAALDPDVVVVKPCGFTLARALEERSILEDAVIRRLPGARVYVTDGHSYFNRPGPRLVESLEIMAACVHPRAFDDFARKHAAEIERLA
ncbi:MAG: ABC transporter substrate-binding protein [Acidobacteriota bacterium]